MIGEFTALQTSARARKLTKTGKTTDFPKFCHLKTQLKIKAILGPALAAGMTFRTRAWRTITVDG